MSIKGNQNAATYKKDIVLTFINKFPNATTMAIARLIYDEHKLDFSSFDTVRTNVRRYRGENGKNSSPVSKAGERTETQKKQSMSKIIDLQLNQNNNVVTYKNEINFQVVNKK